MANIRKFRVQNGLTQRELAEIMGVSQTTITFWENGQTEPNISALVKLSETFDCTIDDLIKGVKD